MPCGHFNCKNCIEVWFYIRTENSNKKDNNTSVEKDDNDTLIEEGKNNSVEEENETLEENDTIFDNKVNGTSDEYQV